MPVKPSEPAWTIPRATSDAVKEHDALIKVLPTFVEEVDQLIVEDAPGYEYADALLGQVREARKKWGAVWSRIMEKTVKPIRDGLEELYQLNRDIDMPAEKLENRIKAKMKEYKTQEAKQIRDADETREREAQRLRNEAAKKEAQLSTARTAQLRGRLEAARAQLEERAAEVEQTVTPEAVVGISSTTRTKQTWKVTDLHAFCRGIADHKVPSYAVLVNTVEINRTWRNDAEGVAAWPGVELVDDITIVGR